MIFLVAHAQDITASVTIQLPPDFVPQILETTKIVFKMFSPFLVPIVAVGIFGITLQIIINRIRQLPLEPGGVSGGFFSRLIKQKKLIAFLFATISAFSTWLALQPPVFREGFMLPIQLLTGLVVSDKALYALATTLFGIAVAALFL